MIYTNHILPIFPPGSSLLISFSASPFVRGWILQICNVRSCYPARPGSAHSDTLSQETTSQFQPKKKEEVATKKKRWRKSPNWNLNLIAKLQSKAVLSHTTRVRTQWARNLFQIEDNLSSRSEKNYHGKKTGFRGFQNHLTFLEDWFIISTIKFQSPDICQLLS